MRPDVQCCLEHLARMGYGVVTTGKLLINPAHCVDRQRARCRDCHKIWEHVCAEEGCSWVCRSPVPMGGKIETKAS